MTVRSKSTGSRKKESAGSIVVQKEKRQPFGVIVDGKSKKSSALNRVKQRRKSRQIGDHVILFVRYTVINFIDRKSVV